MITKLFCFVFAILMIRANVIHYHYHYGNDQANMIDYNYQGMNRRLHTNYDECLNEC